MAGVDSAGSVLTRLRPSLPRGVEPLAVAQGTDPTQFCKATPEPLPVFGWPRRKPRDSRLGAGTEKPARSHLAGSSSIGR